MDQLLEKDNEICGLRARNRDFQLNAEVLRKRNESLTK